MRTFKETLKALRTERKISQGKLASILGVDRSSVSKWESGDRTPELSVGRKIANYFGVSLDYLFGATDDPNQELRCGLLEPRTTQGPFFNRPDFLAQKDKHGLWLSDIITPQATSATELNNQILTELLSLSPKELQRVRDFIAGLKAARKK